ncbi:MAG: polysaccharide biosynthesis protein [Porticoccus sp.]|nr:polysaccharide biosynthesis protein [Porticoccus sp.]
MLNFIINISRLNKILITIFVDISASFLSVWIAFSIRMETFYSFEIGAYQAFLYSLIFLPVFYYLSIYRSILRYVGLITLNRIFFGVTIYSIIYASIIYFIFIPQIPRSIGIIQPLIFFIILIFIRISISGILSENSIRKNRINIVIYGANKLGAQTLNQILLNSRYRVISFIDDDKKLEKTNINGYAVTHYSKIDDLINKHDVNEILVTLPELDYKKKNELVDLFENKNINIKFLQDITSIPSGVVYLDHFKNLDITDLINREIVDFRKEFEIDQGQVFLITGAGGSIGSELSKQILLLDPSIIILVDNTELNLFNIQNDLKNLVKKNNMNCNIISSLNSVCDINRMRVIFKKYNPSYVFHAAAYKHVSLVEENILSAIRNNVLGTFNIAELVKEFKTKYFTLISTDKAVRPSNIMGATKRISEMIVQDDLINFNNDRGVEYSIVRFGNVFASSGSVIQLFKKQIENGGPVTVTDKDATRYFMSISEAVNLIIQATQIKSNGKIFVLEMGEPIKINHIANKMIKLFGLKVKSEADKDGDIEIIYTGLKEGEKLHEELFSNSDLTKTVNDKIMYSEEFSETIKDIKTIVSTIRDMLDKGDEEGLKKILQDKNILSS